MQIDYDPTQVSYQELLDVFWSSHSPVGPTFSRQYASIIFYHDREQKRLALETREREAAKKGKISTEIVPFSRFYLAEDYHQKYQLRRVQDLAQGFSAIYPHNEDFVHSTAVARINGYLGGNGTLEQLSAEIDSYGLSAQGREKLLDILSARWGAAVREACPL